MGLWVWLGAAIMAANLGAVGASDESDVVWKAFTGRIVVSDVLLAPPGDPDHLRIAALRRWERAEIAGGSDGSWRLHMAAFLRKPAGSETVDVIWNDVTEPAAREQISLQRVPVDAAATTLQLNNTVVTRDLGFLPGRRYEIRISRFAGGREELLARTTVTLR